jgi:hypothetical protein
VDVSTTLSHSSRRAARGGHAYRRDPEQRRNHVPAAVAGAAAPTHAPEPEVSAIQREREEMLAIYESPNSCRSRCSASWPGSPRTRSTAS